MVKNKFTSLIFFSTGSTQLGLSLFHNVICTTMYVAYIYVPNIAACCGILYCSTVRKFAVPLSF